MTPDQSPSAADAATRDSRPSSEQPEKSKVSEDFRKQVDQVLLYWIKKVRGWVGAGSVLAFAGIVWAFHVAVVDGAKQEAARIAHDSVDPMTKTVGDALSKSLKDFLDAYTRLDDQKKTLEKSINEGQTTLQTLEGKIKELNKIAVADATSLGDILKGVDQASTDLKALQANLETVKSLDTTKLATVLSELSKGDPTLLPKLEKIFSELERTYTYGIKIVDSNPFQRFVMAVKATDNNLDNFGAFEDQLPGLDGIRLKDPPIDSAFKAVGTDGTGFLVSLPSGSELVATWGIPYNGVVARTYVCTVSKSDPTKLLVNFSAKEKDVGDVTVCILYRAPINPK